MVARGLLVYSAVSVVIVVLCVAQTLQYSQQLYDSTALLSHPQAASDVSSAAPIPWPAKPFSTLSSVASSLPYLLSPSRARCSPSVFVALFVRFRLNVVSLVNLLCSMLGGLTAGLIVRLFSPLSDHEKKACRENLFNFLVFRCVFVAAVVPLELRELACWLSFFAVIAALRVVIIVARERFSSVTVQPTAGADVFVRLVGVMAGVCVVDLMLGAVVWLVMWRADAALSVLCLMLFEHVVLLLGSLKAGGKYVIHLFGLQRDSAWEERNSYLYYCEFVFECLIQLLTIAHYVHVWWLYGLSVTIIDLFLFLHLRSSSLVLFDRISKYHHYRRASVEINSRYADATREELDAAQDFCAICRESMDSAKRLPCGHLFHRTCITQWMEYKGICPSCRAPLLHTAVARDNAASQVRQQQAIQQQRMAALYPAQAAARLAATSAVAQPQAPQPHSHLLQQPASSSSSSSQSAHPPVNDDNLEATLALIRQLQAQDAAQLGSLDFGMLNIANGLAGRAAAVPPHAQAGAAAAGVTGAVEERQQGAARPIGVIGRSLFRISSSSIASWLPSFTFELVRGAGNDDFSHRAAAQTAPHSQQPQRVAAHFASTDVADSDPPAPPTHTLPVASPSSSTSSLSSSVAPYDAHDDSKQQVAAPPSPQSSPTSSFAERKYDETSPPPSPLLSASHFPVSSPSTFHSASSSERSRRDLMYQAFQRRQSANSSNPTTPTAAATPPNPTSRSFAQLPADVAAVPSLGTESVAATGSVECDDEKLDSSFDDINQHASGGEAEEWSDEEELVRTISQALDSKQRDVEHSPYSLAR